MILGYKEIKKLNIQLNLLEEKVTFGSQVYDWQTTIKISYKSLTENRNDMNDLEYVRSKIVRRIKDYESGTDFSKPIVGESFKIDKRYPKV
ncbi:hypothetical protein M153_3810004366 [Pseudoloma neurophilia]|uniref:Uncharacterized protein n=1 Tax=Pseudoloma neurophilia TaxID=146866 RepID=A0A0R0LXS9_9MICR|nr:hypothetical protein M153_3810004366 [Pseudoloma neurophilia]